MNEIIKYEPLDAKRRQAAYEFYRNFEVSEFDIMRGCPEELRLTLMLRELAANIELDGYFQKIYAPGEPIPSKIGFSGEEI